MINRSVGMFFYARISCWEKGGRWERDFGVQGVSVFSLPFLTLFISPFALLEIYLFFLSERVQLLIAPPFSAAVSLVLLLHLLGGGLHILVVRVRGRCCPFGSRRTKWASMRDTVGCLCIGMSEDKLVLSEGKFQVNQLQHNHGKLRFFKTGMVLWQWWIMKKCAELGGV